MKVEFKLTFDPEAGSFDVVNLSTGEIKSVDLPKKSKKSVSKKASKNESSEPQIILEENKYELNSAAVELMQVEPDDRLHIKMEKKDKSFIPTIGTNESFGVKGGNRLTKSFTVSCRGKANEELSTYGTVFNLEAHPTKEGIFYMYGDAVATPLVEDDSVEITTSEPQEEEIDLDLEDLSFTDSDETNSFDFSL